MPVFVAGDWGTTKLRLFLCDAGDDGVQVLESCDSLGVSRVSNDDFESVFLNAVENWRGQYDLRVAILSGMIGSNIGWREVGYLNCPAKPDEIGRGTKVFDVDGLQVGIIPGLCCENALGLADVMRGEETQLLNWSARNNKSFSGLVACPGTHNKWVQLRDGEILHFMTVMTGELYACLRQHSVLVAGNEEPFDEAAFLKAVDTVARQPEQIISVLFSTRSLQVLDQLAAESSSSYLSGLLIGADCAGALKVYDRAGGAVSLLGEPGLNQRYSLALSQLGVRSESVDVSTLGADGYLQLLAHSGLTL